VNEAAATLERTVAILERTPGAFRALLSGLPLEWTTPNEGPNTFSPFDIIGHLVHGERTDWVPRARIVLAQVPGQAFEPYDRFAQVEESRGKTMGQLLDEFTTLRTENLATLREWNLGARELGLMGRHPELGPVSLAQLLATWAAHDLSHVAQAARVMAKQYRDAVGPWRAYLPIMDR